MLHTTSTTPLHALQATCSNSGALVYRLHTLNVGKGRGTTSPFRFVISKHILLFILSTSFFTILEACSLVRPYPVLPISAAQSTSFRSLNSEYPRSRDILTIMGQYMDKLVMLHERLHGDLLPMLAPFQGHFHSTHP